MQKLYLMLGLTEKSRNKHMKKSLIVMDSDAIGDHISHALTIAKSIQKTTKVYALLSNKHGYNLLRQTPYFESCILCNHMMPNASIEDITDVAKSFALYDDVYIPMKRAYDKFKTVDPTLLKNVVKKTIIKEGYRPVKILKEYGLQPTSDVELKLNWYKDFYHDFQCNTNTILVNGESSQTKRNYNNIDQVIKKLNQFDIRTIDCTKDIRTNLHLINQVKYVLTTDTSTLWIAKALSKSPYVFLCNAEFSYSLPVALGVKNIIDDSNCSNINDISADQIVAGFLRSIPKLF